MSEPRAQVDLIEFLAARWDEEQRIAAECIPEGGTGKWLCNEGSCYIDSDIYDEVRRLDEITIYDEGGHSPEQAQHIAYWDPARVLADIVVKRALLSFLDPREAPSGEGRFVAERVLYILAQPHRSHPDFDPVWAV